MMGPGQGQPMYAPGMQQGYPPNAGNYPQGGFNDGHNHNHNQQGGGGQGIMSGVMGMPGIGQLVGSAMGGHVPQSGGMMGGGNHGQRMNAQGKSGGFLGIGGHKNKNKGGGMFGRRRD